MTLAASMTLPAWTPMNIYDFLRLLTLQQAASRSNARRRWSCSRDYLHDCIYNWIRRSAISALALTGAVNPLGRQWRDASDDFALKGLIVHSVHPEMI